MDNNNEVKNVEAIEDMSTKKKLEKEQKKKEKELKKEQKKVENQVKSHEGLAIGIIVALVVIVALAIFGVFLYQKSYKAVVKFDGGYVNTTDYEIYYRTFATILSHYGLDDATIAETIAEKAAADRIIVNAANKAGIKLSDEDKAYVDEIFADEEQLQSFRDAGIDPVRMQQFYYNDYIIDGYTKYLADAFLDDEVKAKIIADEGEDADMREYVTNHILIATMNLSTYEELSDEEKAEKKKLAEEVLAKALAGEDFGSLASEYSDDTATASNSGEYKVYLDSSTDKNFEAAVTSLKVGEIKAELVESTYGYHIIKLVEYNENGRVHSEAIREEMAKDKLDEIVENANITVQNDVMNKVVYDITGTSLTDGEENEVVDDEDTTDDTIEDTSEDEVSE